MHVLEMASHTMSELVLAPYQKLKNQPLPREKRLLFSGQGSIHKLLTRKVFYNEAL